MSIEAVRAVLTRSKAKAGTRLVLLALAERCNEQGIMWPSIPTLCEEAALSERMVRYALRNLAALGEIEEAERGHGRGHTTVYRLLLLNEKRGNGLPQLKGAMDCPLPEEKGQSATRKGAMDCPRTVKEPPREPSIPPNPPPPAAGGEGRGDMGRSKPKDLEAADPRFAAVNAGYCEAYAAAFGEPYAHHGGRDGTALKKLLKSLGDRDYFTADRIVTTAKKAMERRLKPYAKECKFAANLHSFCLHYNDIRTELKTHEHDQKSPAGGDRNAGTLNAGKASQYGGGVLRSNRQ